MTFYERYVNLCEQRKIEPCSQRMANTLNTTRGTISTWGKNNATPRGETVKLIAEVFGVSTDYLLGRTDDPTDYTDPDLIAYLAKPVMEYFNGDVQKTAFFERAVADNARKGKDDRHAQIIKLYDQLDDIDKVRIESYIEGILTNDKYKKKTVNFA
ncbi:MAG: helix-turn-helix domain-containing protein [Clostridiales bacterium]|nr:helix-turn-helix domain-containing protein [Clostridiales bacterium]